MRKSFKAFTLVEMLIVMGIIIILMAVGITAGRYAINRANDVAHQNAVDNIYIALQAYYTDNREFPNGTGNATPAELIDGGVLAEYMDSGTFDGGTEATYLYEVDTTLGQSVLVCVTLGGIEDVKGRGIYCNGNGFNDSAVLSGAVSDKNIAVDATEYGTIGGTAAASGSNYTADSVWSTTPPTNFGTTPPPAE